MNVPKSIIEVLAALRAERQPLAARLDAIDLAIENLNRVYGINRTPQPLPLQRRPRGRPVNGKADVSSEAAARRDLLLSVIGKAEHGTTLSDLRKATPKMDGKDRSNALQALKVDGKIRRDGNAWKAA